MRGQIPLSQGLSQIEGAPPTPRPSENLGDLPLELEGKRDLVRTILAILFVTGLIAASVRSCWY